MSTQAIHNLPGHTPLLIGREKEITEIRQLLDDPQCRLLTLVGPGGIGKTQLAIEVTRQLTSYADGVFFVTLQPVASTELLVPTIATATGLPLAGNDPLPAQLLRNLRHKQLLLILDNFEHLLEGADLLIELLREAPRIKLLVTSREALGIREEWLYSVHGLTVPALDAGDDLASYSAIQLFSTRARQVRHDFRWEDEREAIVSICRQVEGNPLAVELAASWLTVLTCAAIATQLRQGLDILASSLRNLPERHRSMRVVFDHSWQLLGQAERDIFGRLTVFRGGFTLPAAQEVAGASLGTLSAFIAKSLIRRAANGRYHIHELLCQYGAERFAASHQVGLPHAAHAAYYLAFVRELRSVFDGTDQLRGVQAITVEYDNIYAAWRWSVDHIQTGTQAESIRQALRVLYDYYQMRSRYLEGAEIFAETIRRLENGTHATLGKAALAGCLLCNCFLSIRLGRLAEAKRDLTRAIQIRDGLHSIPPHLAMHPQTTSMILALVQGDYARATEMAQQVRRLAQERNDSTIIAFAYYGSASAALAQGDIVQARYYGQLGLAVLEVHGHPWLSTSLHDILGQVACIHGELPEAKRHFEAAYVICAAFEAPGGMAVHLKNLGDVAVRQHLWKEARTLYQQSLDCYQTVGDRGGVATAERGLGIAAYHVGDLNSARLHFRQALEIAIAMQSLPTMLPILAATGIFMVEHVGTASRKSVGLRILNFVVEHSSTDRVTYKEAVACIKRSGVPPNGSAGDSLELIVATLRAELVTTREVIPPLSAAQSHPTLLVESLTSREMEVLRLLAEGGSNSEIASKLVISVGTVKTHTSNIYRKLDVTNRAQAVARVHELGFLE